MHNVLHNSTTHYKLHGITYEIIHVNATCAVIMQLASQAPVKIYGESRVVLYGTRDVFIAVEPQTFLHNVLTRVARAHA